MFTHDEKELLIAALVQAVSSNRRGAAKTNRPAFKVLYDEDERRLSALTMKVHALEVSDGKGKVTARS